MEFLIEGLRVVWDSDFWALDSGKAVGIRHMFVRLRSACLDDHVPANVDSLVLQPSK